MHVVRCIDCKYSLPRCDLGSDYRHCERFNNIVVSLGFCHDGSDIHNIPNITKVLDAVDYYNAHVLEKAHGFKPVYGTNSDKDRGYTDTFECESCGNYVLMHTYSRECEYDYCPYCGVRNEVSE